MKCVCGYYHLEDWQIELEEGDTTELKANNGRHEFVRIECNATREEDYGMVSVVRLYACPKCGTVKAEV